MCQLWSETLSLITWVPSACYGRRSCHSLVNFPFRSASFFACVCKLLLYFIIVLEVPLCVFFFGSVSLFFQVVVCSLSFGRAVCVCIYKLDEDEALAVDVTVVTQR